ncbi:restriction endonuclease [Priestia koreensis]|uniref:restriction endonuclease n=1 Tax=Priestia koreensis TaxID=284581 RepID=UPI0030167271
MNPTAYDRVAFEISNYLQPSNRSEFCIERKMYGIFALSSDDVKNILEMMEKIDLLVFTDQHWSLSPTLSSLIVNDDKRINTLISSFQYGNISNIYLEEANSPKVDETELDELDILMNEIHNKIETYNNMLRIRLKDTLLKMNPYRLEEIVVELLVKSGEGKAGYATKKSNDGGIDGYIFRTLLKQGPMAIQTKRYADHVYVKNSEIHQFISAYKNKGVKEAYFVTTSSFSETAEEIGKMGLCLIDGDKLLNMIFTTKIGLRKISDILYSIDEKYFNQPPVQAGQLFEVFQ